MNQIPFTVEELPLPGVLLIRPTVRRDRRGFSSNVYNPEIFATLGITAIFAEDFTSRSKKGVLRGLHFQQAPHEQSKLVRCTFGTIYDIAADCDPTSPTYGNHAGVELSGDTQTTLYIPGQYAHGFCVLSEEAVVEYKLTDTYHPESVRGVRYDDSRLGITWPITDPILSDADRVWSALP